MNHHITPDVQSAAEVEAALHLDSKLSHISDLKSPLHEESKVSESAAANDNNAYEVEQGWSNSHKEIWRNSERLSSLSNHISFSKEVPNMWSKHYIGLYAQYAAIGLLYGTAGALTALCVYVYNGSPNLCANSSNITFFAWSFKIVFAVLTDTYRPFGLRRKPWMLFGWSMVLVILLVLAIFADKLSASSWVALLMLIQFFAMFSDVPADGYSVELGQIEPPDRRGVILATGQIIRFSFCMIAGLIQAVLLNGPSTNQSDCAISFDNCWSWGLTINQYYALLFVLVTILTVPIIWLKETDPSTVPQHTLEHFSKEIWATLQNQTTLYLLIFVIGVSSLTNFTSIANIYMQYYVIQLTNFEAGVDTITTYLALSVAIYVFKTYLLNRNWRYTQYGSTIFASFLQCVWILVYYNVGNLQNPWFTIFIDCDQYFVMGLTQVLFSLAVIELSSPGLEATTYELLITTANASSTLCMIIGTQLLTPLKAAACVSDDDYVDDQTINCSSNSVDVNSKNAYFDTDGPYRYTLYCITLTVISIVCCLIFTPFLPKSKEQCAEWKAEGEKIGHSTVRGYISLFLACSTIGYGFAVAILLIDSGTSCLEVVGGTGC